VAHPKARCHTLASPLACLFTQHLHVSVRPEIDVFSGGSHRIRVNVNRETLRDAEGHCGDREDARPGANVEGTGRGRARQEGVEELKTPLGRLVLPCSERPPRADLNDALPDAGRDALPWRDDPHAPDSNRPKVDLPGLLPSAVVELKDFNRAQGSLAVRAFGESGGT